MFYYNQGLRLIGLSCAASCSALQCAAMRCIALQCVAVRCSVLQCVLQSQNLRLVGHAHILFVCDHV